MGSSAIELISSGKPPVFPTWEGWRTSDPYPNALLSITPDGSNVFFTASEALTQGAGENGTQGIYDARINGGFPAPPLPAFCEEEACKGSASGQASSFAVPQSEATAGSGNVKARKRHCAPKKSTGGKKRHCAGSRGQSGPDWRRSPLRLK